MQTLKPSNPKTIAQQTLLACARSQPEPEGLEPLLRAGLDWDHFLDLGAYHKLLPLAYARLRELGGDRVPPKVMAQLQGNYYANLAHIVRLQASLAQIVTALQAAGLQPIVLKGGALAGTVYPDPGLRPMGDLDLLVPTADMARAGTALVALGFRLSAGLPARMVAFQQRLGGGLEYLCRGDFGLTRVDLQHDLVGVDLCRHAFAIEPGALWAAARPLALEHGQALQLSAEDTLIHLCLHPALHHGYA
ncbi:MAG: nucleotidyltransferase domain-containing protein, partial [Anaerolineae bacterium]